MFTKGEGKNLSKQPEEVTIGDVSAVRESEGSPVVNEELKEVCSA